MNDWCILHPWSGWMLVQLKYSYKLYLKIVQQLKNRWHSPYILVYKHPLLIYLLVSVPSILTLRYITEEPYNPYIDSTLTIDKHYSKGIFGMDFLEHRDENHSYWAPKTITNSFLVITLKVDNANDHAVLQQTNLNSPRVQKNKTTYSRYPQGVP